MSFLYYLGSALFLPSACLDELDVSVSHNLWLAIVTRCRFGYARLVSIDVPSHYSLKFGLPRPYRRPWFTEIPGSKALRGDGHCTCPAKLYVTASVQRSINIISCFVENTQGVIPRMNCPITGGGWSNLDRHLHTLRSTLDDIPTPVP